MRVIYIHINIVCMQYDVYGRVRVIPSVSVSVSPSNLGQETRITRPHTDEIIYRVLPLCVLSFVIMNYQRYFQCIISKTNLVFDIRQIQRNIQVSNFNLLVLLIAKYLSFRMHQGNNISRYRYGQIYKADPRSNCINNFLLSL